MKILLVSATQSEIEPVLSHFNFLNSGEVNGHTITVLVTGVGMTATAYALGKLLASEHFDLALNAGIAGAFDKSIKIAEVLNVSQDCFAELGAEDGQNFLTVDSLGLGKSSIKPTIPFLHPLVSQLKQVRSITVNKVHGNDESIDVTASRLNPQTESMEGAAFFYACNEAKLSCLQLRAISNYVERRNRASWEIPLAIKNLNNTLIQLISQLP
ncbi:MAG: futalosine hydrolase [Sphingobacteriaceae bacterium]|nr:futalosine hydrolase [Sphingobacteriaceae bacterium]